MTYCTLTDIRGMAPESDLVELTDDSDAGVIDQAKIDAAIGYADELINGYLRGKYDLPMSPVPPLLKNLAADIALYRLYKNRSKLAVPEAIKDGHANAIKLLGAIQAGTIALGVGGTGTASAGDIPSSGGAVSTPTSGRVFSRDNLGNF